MIKVGFSPYRPLYRSMYLSNNYYILYTYSENLKIYSLYFMEKGEKALEHVDWKFKEDDDFLLNKDKMLKKAKESLYREKKFILNHIFGDK